MDKSLEQLKDIHLPEPVSWWPMSWQLLTLTLIIVALLGIAVASFIHFYNKGKVKREALRLLITIKQKNLDNKSYLDELAQLVRRLAIARQPDCSQLSGEQWQQILSKHMEKQDAEVIALSRYQANIVLDRDSLLNSCEKFIKEFKA